MQISSGTSAALTAVQQTPEGDSARIKFNTTLLKKSLDMQQQQVSQLLSAMEGKGQNLDIRA